MYSLLSDEYKIAVVEKFGYGFSDVIDKSRGLEALYWAQKYPEEVSTIIGLDMRVPQLPMLLFISDGSGGTGFDKETWRSVQEDY